MISYSMYLLNLFIIDNIVNPYYVASSTKGIVFFSITILSSTLLYKYYEVPMTNLRDK